ncbi:MAG: rhodanese-like domain-containing protein, partial [Pseudorhodoplanes sp.]
LAEQLIDAGFHNVRRYQLGIPVWRALGGPVVVELDGVLRVARSDRSAVLVDARDAAEFSRASLPGAISAPVREVVSGALKKIALPEDDFNRRIILFGNGDDARSLADYMSKRPWHNVSYFPGNYESLASALKAN